MVLSSDTMSSQFNVFIYIKLQSFLITPHNIITGSHASFVFSSSKFQHITPLLCQLHWLKAPEQTAFKQSVLVNKCLHGSAPAYLTDELCHVADMEARQRLHSSSSSSLTVSCTRLSYCCWPTFPGHLCSCLEQSARSCHFYSTPSVVVFWSQLKTHLFNISYPFPLWLYSACRVL